MPRSHSIPKKSFDFLLHLVLQPNPALTRDRVARIVLVSSKSQDANYVRFQRQTRSTYLALQIKLWNPWVSRATSTMTVTPHKVYLCLLSHFLSGDCPFLSFVQEFSMSHSKPYLHGDLFFNVRYFIFLIFCISLVVSMLYTHGLGIFNHVLCSTCTFLLWYPNSKYYTTRNPAAGFLNLP